MVSTVFNDGRSIAPMRGLELRRRRGQFDAARQQVSRRRFAAHSTPATSSSTSAQDVVLQKDFLNVAAAPTNGSEATVTRDADGGMRIYAAGTTVRVLASESGDPVRTIGASSTAEQTFCSLTVPANTLGTAGKCVLELVGDITNNSGGANSYQLKVKFGAATAYDKTSSFSTGTQPRPLVMRVHLCALGSVALQRMTAELYHGYLLGATTGYGDWGDFNGRAFTMQGPSAALSQDSTTALALDVTVRNSVNNANIYWRLYSAKLVYYP